MAQSPRPKVARVRRSGSSAKFAALQIEVGHNTALCRRHSEELAIQFKRIAQLQAELDEVKKTLKLGS